MPDYVTKVLQRLEHPIPSKPRHAPHRWVPKTYGQKVHLTPLEDTSEPFFPSEIRHIQSIVGIFLYYERAVDTTINTTLNNIATTQASPTMETQDATLMIMDYFYTHPNAKSRYHTSNMQLYIDLDAAYLLASKAKSHIAGYFYLSNHYTEDIGNPTPTLNALIHIECQLLKYVVTSAVEAETSAIFHNYQ